MDIFYTEDKYLDPDITMKDVAFYMSFFDTFDLNFFTRTPIDISSAKDFNSKDFLPFVSVMKKISSLLKDNALRTLAPAPTPFKRSSPNYMKKKDEDFTLKALDNGIQISMPVSNEDADKVSVEFEDNQIHIFKEVDSRKQQHLHTLEVESTAKFGEPTSRVEDGTLYIELLIKD